MKCLDENQVLRLLDGALSEDARADVEAHLDECAACRRVIGAAAHEEDDAPALERGASIGRYIVLSLLGRGGMGRVYKAYDPQLDRRVALKLLDAAYRSEHAQRLIAREARALGKLSHPNVVQVYDVGEHEGDVFVAMELVDGAPLDAWCRGTPKPSHREVLDAYVQAARGLLAAHQKGLVHRDVKPSNILRGDDGRVRVADFGLAAIRQAAPLAEGPEAAQRGASLDVRLSVTGALLGTPLYMAPEQHEGAHATASSDQYSLCVALYEGLYGAPPFPPSRAQLLAAKRAGPPASPPPGATAPAWVHAALVRGLAPRPEDRFPSLEELIAALRDDVDARRRRLWGKVAGGALAGTLVAVAAVGWSRNGALRDPCAHPERHLAGAWDADVKSRVRAALQGTGRPHADATAALVLARLDGYAAAWVAMRGEVCAASDGGRAPRESLDVRDACLDRRRDQLAALTAVLAERPDPQILDKAVEMAARLYPISTCADTEALLARVRPPEEPAVRARVAELQPRVDRVEALYKAGKYKDGLALGEALLVETEHLPYAPLRAQVELLVGQLREGTGDYEGAKAMLREAAVSAAEGKDDLLAVTAWADLLFVVAERQRQLEEASVIRELGPTATARVHDAQTLARWSSAEGAALDRMDRHAEAWLAHERALALRESVGPDHPDTAVSLNNLGTLLCRLGDCWIAKPYLERAVAVSERALGLEHPETARSLGNLGNVLRHVGEYPGALAADERALAIKERTLGPDHPSVAATLTNLGNLLHEMGDDERARAVHERALAIKERSLGADHPEVASSLVGLGRALIGTKRLDEALPLLERALASGEKRFGPMHPDLVWPLVGLGELALARRDPEKAEQLLDRALSLEKNTDARSEIQLLLAEASWLGGKDRARARGLAAQAADAYAQARHRPGLERATRFLVEHPPEG